MVVTLLEVSVREEAVEVLYPVQVSSRLSKTVG